MTSSIEATAAPDDADLRDLHDLRERIEACWLGKAVGGTLGMPFEGYVQPLGVSFYEPVPTEMLSNDDLDLQVLWAGVIDAMGESPRVDRHALAAAWRDDVDFPFDEYGIAKRNIALGLVPPHTGSYDNPFTRGMGAAIRSEIWACLAAGDPAKAAAYAYEDACVDHAGAGIEAEQFFAALEAAAFVERDADRLLEAAYAVLPGNSIIAGAVRDTVGWWRGSKGDWRDVRRRVLDAYYDENFTDVVQNVCFTVLGWLDGYLGGAGGYDSAFGRAICTATNCGFDTDCTAATAGAIMGILDPGGIPPRWLAPIGQKLVVDPRIRPPRGHEWPETLAAFTDLVLDLRRRLPAEHVTPADAGPLSDETLGRLSVEARVAFVDSRRVQSWRDGAWMPVMGAARPDEAALPVVSGGTMRFDGTAGELSAEQFAAAPTAMMTFAFDLDEPRRVRLLFNTPCNCRVWLDDDFAFGRECGRMGPSFHRRPPHQFHDADLEAGRHEVTVLLARPDDGPARWVVGVGDARTHQWLPTALREKR